MRDALWIFVDSGLVTLGRARVIDYRAEQDVPEAPEIWAGIYVR